MQATNLRSVFLCCKHGIPHLLDGGGGSVINTASFVAVTGSATSQISYTASKGGVLAMSRELGVEFALRGVRVNALCPGPVDTPLLRELFAKDPVQARRRLVHVPMGRFARADEIANAVLFLASDESTLRQRDRVHGRRRDQRGVHDPGVNLRVGAAELVTATPPSSGHASARARSRARAAALAAQATPSARALRRSRAAPT